ncbi:Purine-cytosine permease [Nakamurella panacisegetis]|uniref:Purine-cytosine permease n=1 Tax=Nakamurella panacisegetis TaxID=1090615 RepID=A0A1H0PDT5_9ACTN|nr:cytosine permease [Nakamurella panacisegetis]SDP02799.1 Purine-cytosine permease [Nakamurella panacisegetis]
MTTVHPEIERSGVSAPILELNGINVIDPVERKGKPSNLFWPWCAANVGVLGMGYAAYLLFHGVSFLQALVAGVIGIIGSFLLVGFSALAGKRGSAPTMILSRAPFGVLGNRLPSLVSYLLLVGWEIVTMVLAISAVGVIFERLGWSTGTATKIGSFVVVAGVIAVAGTLGFDVIMRFQKWITYLMILLTIGFVIITASHIHPSALKSLPTGGVAAFVGAVIFAFTGFGLSWANTAADYSRYLPTSVRGSSVVGWTTFGASVGPVLLILDGLLLTGSDPALLTAVGNDPIGGLGTILPTWYLVPFILVALLGLIGSAVLDIYSSGLALLSLGLKTKRHIAVSIDVVIMVLGTVYLVWIAAGSFLGSFTGFLITLGVPIAAWTGIFLADMLLRRRNYAEADLYSSRGRYGAANVSAVALMLLGSGVGFGLVVSTAEWLAWQGYLLAPLHLGPKNGTWANANLGVVISLAIGFVGYLALNRRRVRTQESV